MEPVFEEDWLGLTSLPVDFLGSSLPPRLLANVLSGGKTFLDVEFGLETFLGKGFCEVGIFRTENSSIYTI